MQKHEKTVESTELMGSTIYFEPFRGLDIRLNKDGLHYWGVFHSYRTAMGYSYCDIKKRRNTIYVDASTEGVYRLVFFESDYTQGSTPSDRRLLDINIEFTYVVNWSERLPDETPELAGYRLFWAYVRLIDDLLPEQPEATSTRFGVNWTDGSDIEQKVLFVFAAVRKTALPWNIQREVRREAPDFIKQSILSRIVDCAEFNANNDAKPKQVRVLKKAKKNKNYSEIQDEEFSDDHILLLEKITQYDPLGFMRAMQGNEDYANEVMNIFRQMQSVSSREEMHELIYDEFARRDAQRLIGPKERYWNLACDVFENLTEKGKAEVIEKKEKSEKRYKAEKAYVAKHVFAGLRNINDGFDAPGIAYFTEAEFALVLDRVEKLGIGISGIEPWYQDEFFGVEIPEQCGKQSTDPSWYRVSFENFKKLGLALQYSASYHVPDHLLEGDF